MSSQPSNAQGPAPEARGRKASLKAWWHALTHRRDSKDDGHDATQDTALHRMTYKPRHAKRDAMLSVPLADRQYRSGINIDAAKRRSTPLATSEGLSVHPNRDISLERMGSLSSCRSAALQRSKSWSPFGSSGSPIHSIREDCHGESSEDISHPESRIDSSSTGARPRVRAPPTAHPHDRHSGSDAADSAKPESSSGCSTISSAASPNDSHPPHPSSSADGWEHRELMRLLERHRQQNATAAIARQLQDRISPQVHRTPTARRPVAAGGAAAIRPRPGPVATMAGRRGRMYFSHGGGVPEIRRPSASTPDHFARDASGALEVEAARNVESVWRGEAGAGGSMLEAPSPRTRRSTSFEFDLESPSALERERDGKVARRDAAASGEAAVEDEDDTGWPLSSNERARSVSSETFETAGDQMNGEGREGV